VLKTIDDVALGTNLGDDAYPIRPCLALAEDVDTFFATFVANASLSVPHHTLMGAKPEFKLARIVDIITSAFAALSSDVQFTLFIDGLAVRTDDVAYPDYLSVISSICNTIWILNSSKLSRSAARLKIVLLVRPDIFDVVSIQNRGPKLQNHSHLVEWPARYGTFEASELFKLTDRVLRCQQTSDLRLREGDSWGHYFNFLVNNRASGKVEDNPFILFLRHSFYKPRDILQYLSIMAERIASVGSKDSSHFPPDVFDDWEIKDRFSAYPVSYTHLTLPTICSV